MTTENPASQTYLPTPDGVGAGHEAPSIVALGTLEALTLGAGAGATDGFDGFGVS